MSGTIIQEQEHYACPECNGVEFISDVQRGDVICRGCSIVTAGWDRLNLEGILSQLLFEFMMLMQI